MKDPIINLYKIDCLPFMKKCEYKRYDVGVVDPPYGIKESSKNHKSRNTPIKQKNGTLLKAPDNNYIKKTWDNEIPSDEYFSELKRITKNQIIWGANYFKALT